MKLRIMLFFIYASLSVSLLSQTVWGSNLDNFFNNHKAYDNTFLSTEQHFETGEILSSGDDGYDNRTATYRSDQENLDPSQISANESSETDEINESTSNISQLTSSESSNNSIIHSTLDTYKTDVLTENFNNESHSSSSGESFSPASSSVVINEATKSKIMSTTISGTSAEFNKSSPPDEESEGVVIGKPLTSATESNVTSLPKSIYQKSLELISDTYTLSILLPVAAGVLFATTIIVTIAICRCLRRRCRRRRFHRKPLPDSVKNLRPSDHARLLAESSDEEF